MFLIIRDESVHVDVVEEDTEEVEDVDDKAIVRAIKDISTHVEIVHTVVQISTLRGPIITMKLHLRIY